MVDAAWDTEPPAAIRLLLATASMDCYRCGSPTGLVCRLTALRT
ncbi:hypothetical protein ACVILH_004857 [Bradyrhizobium sp. USDA 4353]